MIGKVYKIVNNINDKVYIGQTWQPLGKRFRDHVSEEQKSKLSKAAFQRQAKISLEEAENIRLMKINGESTKIIAKKYAISESYTRGIINGSRRNRGDK